MQNQGENASQELENNLLNRTNIRADVYNLLRKRIMNSQYPPGYRFNLSDLETELGISRTPLKEAMHRLEAEGLVDIVARRGTFVTKVNPHQIAESFEIRRALELGAAETAVVEATKSELAQLREILNEMKQLLDADDYQSIVQRYISLDHRSHKLIVALARNQMLNEIYDQIGVHVQIAHLRRKFDRPDSTKTESEHEMIMQALERRDTPAFLGAIREHIRLSQARALKVLGPSA